MKIKLLLLWGLAFLLTVDSDARNLTAFFSVCTFNAPGKGPYVETYLNVVGNSVKLTQNSKGKYQGKVEVELTFTFASSNPSSGGQAGAIKYHDKYNLLGSEIDDSLGFRPDFIDQQRILMPNGDYDLELKLSDKFLPEQSFTVHRAVKVDYHDGNVRISDIELLATYNKAGEENNFTKSGYDVIPLVSDFFPEVLKSLKFYAEIYNTKTALDTDSLLINYFVASSDNLYIYSNMQASKHETPKDVCVLLAELPIKDLYTGNYNFTIEVKNKSNVLLARKQVFFQRSNTKAATEAGRDIKTIDITHTFATFITSKDTLKNYIKYLHPISTPLEAEFADNQLEIADLKYMQQYFYDFWEKRNSSNPEKAWRDYLIEVKKVNANYSTGNAKGYATDRGRVYLQYGPPNSIYKEENEPAAYPYEIWHYYKLGSQSNRKFLFYCHEAASNDYTLLHSDAVGEIYNDRWQTDLYSRTSGTGNDLDQTTSPDHFGKKAVDEFNNPK